MWRYKWAAAALLAAIAGATAAWGMQTVSEVRVTTAPVTSGPITRRVAAAGTLQAVTTVEVGAQVSGIVQSLAADYNSFVRAGQVVARLDPASYDAQWREAQAALAQTEAALGRAQADVLGFETARQDAQTKYTRAESLSREQLIPQSDLDAARIALDSAAADLASGRAGVAQARAAVDEARAGVEQAAVNLAHTIIRSPIDGIVIDRSVDVGQTLASAVQSPVLFRIAADLTRMQVQVEVDESDVGGLTPGDAVTFEVEAYPRETFHGTLSQVRLQPVADLSTTAATTLSTAAAPAPAQPASVVSYIAIVDVANADQRLRPGMTAEVVLRGSRRERAVRIPNGALAFRPPMDVLQALGTSTVPSARTPEGSQLPGDGRPPEVWEYDGKRLTPIPVVAGLADDGWTELVSGAIHSGDALVTSAGVQRHHRL